MHHDLYGVKALKTRLFDCIEQKEEPKPSAKRHGPGIQVGGRAHGIWMSKMIGEK